jgi:chlorophyll synthase
VQLACIVMAAPQVVVVGLLLSWGRPIFAAVVAALLVGQFILMPRLIQNPRKWAISYNATGTTLYVIGMLVSAFAVRSIG